MVVSRTYFLFFTKMHILRVRTGCLTPAQLIVRHRHIHGRAHAPACSGQALRSGVPATLVQFALSFTRPSSRNRAMARFMGALAIAMHAAAGAERCARGVCSPMAIASPVQTSKPYDACVTLSQAFVIPLFIYEKPAPHVLTISRFFAFRKKEAVRASELVSCECAGGGASMLMWVRAC
jgi:hypothetical protein